MTSDDDMLTEVERFRAEHDIPETTFGRRAAGDPNLIAGMRSGRELRRATRLRLRAFMEAYPDPAEQGAAA